VSLCLTKHHAIKVYRGVEVQLHVLLTSVLGGGELSASRPGRFIPGTHTLPKQCKQKFGRLTVGMFRVFGHCVRYVQEYLPGNDASCFSHSKTL
jgi:hypothetical protein